MISIEHKLFDFNQEVQLGQDIYTEYQGKTLVLKNVYKYEGPITMQYLPYGGIQSVYQGKLIITTKSGFITPMYIIYEDIVYTNEEFTSRFTDLVNHILPC